jgi:hypothetical protein
MCKTMYCRNFDLILAASVTRSAAIGAPSQVETSLSVNCLLRLASSLLLRGWMVPGYVIVPRNPIQANPQTSLNLCTLLWWCFCSCLVSFSHDSLLS